MFATNHSSGTRNQLIFISEIESQQVAQTNMAQDSHLASAVEIEIKQLVGVAPASFSALGDVKRSHACDSREKAHGAKQVRLRARVIKYSIQILFRKGGVLNGGFGFGGGG